MHTDARTQFMHTDTDTDADTDTHTHTHTHTHGMRVIRIVMRFVRLSMIMI